MIKQAKSMAGIAGSRHAAAGWLLFASVAGRERLLASWPMAGWEPTTLEMGAFEAPMELAMRLTWHRQTS